MIAFDGSLFFSWPEHHDAHDPMSIVNFHRIRVFILHKSKSHVLAYN